MKHRSAFCVFKPARGAASAALLALGALAANANALQPEAPAAPSAPAGAPPAAAPTPPVEDTGGAPPAGPAPAGSAEPSEPAPSPTPPTAASAPALAPDAPAAVAAGAPPAAAVTPKLAPSLDAPAPAKPLVLAAMLPSLDVWLGFRDSLVAGAGLDPFAEDNQVPAFRAGVGWSFGGSGTTDVAAVVTFEGGGTSALDRGEKAELGVQRIGLGPELRISALDRLYLLARVAPQAVHVSTELTESSSGARLAANQWAFGVDGTLGAVLRFADLRPEGLDTALGLFLRLEAGYAWTAKLEQQLRAGGGAPVRTAPLSLAELSLAGASFAGAVGLAY
jgi:hypothetical protein